MNVMGSLNGTTNVTFTRGKASLDTSFAEELIEGLKDVVATLVH